MSDPIAAHHAAAFIGDRLFDTTAELDADTARDLGSIVGGEFLATYQRRVNEAGVAVRQLVLTGPEEVDGAAPNGQRAA